MSKRYLIGNKNSKHLTDTHGSNMIKDLLVLLGISSEYEEDRDYLRESFEDYYNRITNIYCGKDFHKFSGEWYYYNRGVDYLRKQYNHTHKINKQNKTSKVQIKKICFTRKNHKVMLPKNADEVLAILFDTIFAKEELKAVFLEKIVVNCKQYTDEINNFPKDCIAGVLGFVDGLLCHISLYNKGYSDKTINTARTMYLTITELFNKCDLSHCCGRRI